MSLNFFGGPRWMILTLLTPMLSKNDQSPTYFRFFFVKIIWFLSFRVLDMTKDEWEFLVITSAKLNQNQWNTAPLKYNIIKNTEQDITNTPTFLPRIFLENFNCHFNINGCWYIAAGSWWTKRGSLTVNWKKNLFFLSRLFRNYPIAA